MAALVGVVIGLLRWQRVPAVGEGRWMLAPALLFALALAWRGSGVLAALNVLAVLVSLALVAARTREGQWRHAGLGEFALALPVAAINATLSALALLLADVRWQSIPRSGLSGRTVAVVRGVLLAAPLLLIFGGLFMAADATFEALVLELLDWDWETIASHLFLIAVWGWLSAGFLRQTLLERSPPSLSVGRPGFLGLGSVETSIVLGALNLLFLSFVLVQSRYFFGGPRWSTPPGG